MKPVGKMRKKNKVPAIWQRLFSQNLEGGGVIEFGKDILANLNYADSLTRFAFQDFLEKISENIEVSRGKNGVNSENKCLNSC